MSKHKKPGPGVHKGAPTSHKAEQRRRTRKISILVAAMLAVGGAVAPAGAYTVRSGDTLSSIAHRHDTSVARLARINRIEDPDRIHVGDRLRLRVRRDVERSAERSAERSVAVSRSGSRVNRAAPRFSRGPIPAAGSWHRHSGYPWATWAGDINVPGSGDYGAPVRSAGSGRVTDTNYWTSSYGYHVEIGDKLYAHLSKILVRPGQYVRRGQVIGLVGDTGNAAGPHLHYETGRR